MTYADQQNKLYQRILRGAIPKFKKEFKDIPSDPDLCHPIRSVSTYEIMPLHMVFNTANKNFPRDVLNALNANPSIFEAVEFCANQTPVLVNTLLEGGDETFETQVTGAVKLLLMHAFFSSEAHVVDEKGEKTNTRILYKKINTEQMHVFKEKSRYIEGYYLFIGDETTTIALMGKPIKNSEQLCEIFYDFTLNEFPLNDEVEFIKLSIKNGSAKVKAISILKRYLHTKNIKKSIKGLK